MKKLMFLFLALLSLQNLAAQESKSKKAQKATIMTSSECGNCKERIEGKLNYTKGIVFSELNYDSKELVVKFKPNVISLEQIKKIVSELGYDADEIKADKKAQNKLPLCCQPGGMKK
jgi:copper chaperone CopZ